MADVPLRERPAYAALAAHYAKIEGHHLRDLFAADPERGERLIAEAAGLYLDYSKNRVTDETMLLLVELARAVRARAAPGRDVRRRAHQRLREPRGAARRPAHAAGHARSSSTASTSSPRCTRSWTGWLPSPTGSARGSGRATPASRSATSSTSASAAPTSVR